MADQGQQQEVEEEENECEENVRRENALQVYDRQAVANETLTMECDHKG